jgi:hypothetical protein
VPAAAAVAESAADAGAADEPDGGLAFSESANENEVRQWNETNGLKNTRKTSHKHGTVTS